MTTRNELSDKYTDYQSQGHAIFAVTLSTYVTSDAFAASDAMRKFWDHHFIYRVKRCLPVRKIKRLPVLPKRGEFREKRIWLIEENLDHDWTLEMSNEGYYHYHGFIAVEGKYGSKIWDADANVLNKKLFRALASFSNAGKYRSFRVNAFEIVPVTNAAAWSTYITKQTTPNV